jgi:hypothetical protein
MNGKLVRDYERLRRHCAAPNRIMLGVTNQETSNQGQKHDDED